MTQISGQINYQVEYFEPKKASDELIDLYFDYTDSRFKDLNPDDPMPSRELNKKHLLDEHPHYKVHRWIAIDTLANRVVGSASSYYELEESPAYEENKHTVWGGVGVSKEFRRQGIGTALIKAHLTYLKDTDRTVYQTSSSEEDGLAFLDGLVFGIKAMEGAQNRLYLKNVDWDLIEEWDKVGPKRAKGVQLEAFFDVPKNDLLDYTQFYTEVVNLAPKEELEWEANITPESRRIHENKVKDKGYIWRTLVSRESNGELSGMTEIFYNRANAHLVSQELTAVRPKYRGRGLGKWLKANMLLYIKEQYSEVKYIVTGNANSNAAMLAINEQMGYKRYRASTDYKFQLSDLYNKFLD